MQRCMKFILCPLLGTTSQASRILIWERRSDAPVKVHNQPSSILEVDEGSDAWRHSATLLVSSMHLPRCLALDVGDGSQATLRCGVQALLLATAGAAQGSSNVKSKIKNSGEGGHEAPGIAEVFRLDPRSSSTSVWGWDESREITPKPRSPALQWQCETAITCATMLSTFLYEKQPLSDEGPVAEGRLGTTVRSCASDRSGTASRSLYRLLACGSEDGNVRLVSLSGNLPVGDLSLPVGDRSMLSLPSPHEACIAARRTPAGGCTRARGWPLLSLTSVAPETELGLLVGAYCWGFALWQASNQNLVNIFGREEVHLPLPTPVEVCASGFRLVLLTHATPLDESPVIYHRPHWSSSSLDGYAARVPEFAENEPLGFIAVSAGLRWERPASLQELVQSFTIMRCRAKRHGSFSCSALGRADACDDANPCNARAPLVELAVNGAYLIAMLMNEVVCVWHQRTTLLLHTIRLGDGPQNLSWSLLTSYPTMTRHDLEDKILLLESTTAGIVLHAWHSSQEKKGESGHVPLAVCRVGTDRQPAPQQVGEICFAASRTRAPAIAQPTSQSLEGFQDALLAGASQESDAPMAMTPQLPQFIY
eukprot:scaffold271188_cov35-Tisochrysis_lutea.AAC.2